jgi:molybdate transport system substrate-binding protein
MTTWWARMRGIASAAGLAALLLLPPAHVVHAAELQLLSANNMRPTLTDLAVAFTLETGHRLVITSDSLRAVKDRVQAGERFDLIITQKSLLEELLEQGRILPGITDIARAAVVLYVREGAPKPDIETADALRHTLMSAASITYPDASVGTPGAIYFPRVLERLGIVDAMKSKAKVTSFGGGFELVARGECALGVAQTFDFAPPMGPPVGVDLVGPLPESVQERLVLSTAILATSHESGAAANLIAFLSSPIATKAIAAHGMER